MKNQGNVAVLLSSLVLTISNITPESNGASVRLIGQWPAQVRPDTQAGYASDLEISGNYAYIADGTPGVRVIDITDPGNPTLVGGYASSGRLAAHGNRLLIGSEIVDISNPATPTLLGRYDSPGGQTMDVAWWGDYALFLDLTGKTSVRDIANPALSTEVGALYSSRGYSGDGGQRLWVSGEYVLFVSTFHDVLGITIAHGVGSFDTGGSFIAPPNHRWENSPYAPKGGAVSGHYAFLLNSGLEVVDISNLANPTLANKLSGLGGLDIDISGHVAAVAGALVQFVDISAPQNPAVLGNFTPRGSGNRIIIKGSLAYVATGFGGLQILDFGDLLAPNIHIIRDGSHLQFQMAGKTGKQHRIEFATAMPAPGWQTLQTFPLDQSPQTITVDVPDSSRFYRAVELP